MHNKDREVTPLFGIIRLKSKLYHHVQDTFTNQVETGENDNIMFLQCTH